MNRPSAARTAAPAVEKAQDTTAASTASAGSAPPAQDRRGDGRDRAEAGHRVGPGRRPRQRPGHDQHAQAHGRAGHGRSGTPGIHGRAGHGRSGTRPGGHGRAAGALGRPGCSRAADAGRRTAEGGEHAVEFGAGVPAEHRDAEVAQGRTSRRAVQAPQAQGELGVGRTRAGGRLIPQRVHHDQREPALPQVGQGGETARVEQRREHHHQRARRQRGARDAADVGGDVAVVAGLEHHLGDPVELPVTVGRAEPAQRPAEHHEPGPVADPQVRGRQRRRPVHGHVQGRGPRPARSPRMRRS